MTPADSPKLNAEAAPIPRPFAGIALTSSTTAASGLHSRSSRATSAPFTCCFFPVLLRAIVGMSATATNRPSSSNASAPLTPGSTPNSLTPLSPTSRQPSPTGQLLGSFALLPYPSPAHQPLANPKCQCPHDALRMALPNVVIIEIHEPATIYRVVTITTAHS